MQGHMSFVRKSARKFLGVRTIAVQGNPRPSPPDRTFSALAPHAVRKPLFAAAREPVRLYGAPVKA